MRCSLPFAWPPNRQERAASNQHLPITSIVQLDKFNRLIMRGLVPVGENT